MTTQTEQTLENELIKQLKDLGHTFVAIKDEKALLANLKAQLEKHNSVTLSDKDFEKVLNHLNKGNIFDRAKILRDRFHLDKEDGESTYIQFINQEEWCQNQFQVTHQVTNDKGSYTNRYDVTLLINGLPLVQIELKRRGLELKEAFNQVNRYHKHSFGASHGLFQYIQIFVISNGVNTKYYTNNPKQEYKQTFYWSDKENNKITQLSDFASIFLEPCHIAKMITKYTVINETLRILMVLRPYQYYAVEAIVERVKTGRKNGYIWHTTGSGKTLTSFKASQLLIENPKVHKVVFVVDRKDLDYQTSKEFDSFSKGSVDSASDSGDLYKKLLSDTKEDKLVVTTIQKLNNVITKQQYESKMESLKDKRIIFIFDECHRSQFGDTHKRITEFFILAQMFGFTGTPIFKDNAMNTDQGKRTTADLFEESLHKYVITDAIGDENVLKFSVEYVGKYKENHNKVTDVDIEVEDIDTKELLESPRRLNKIVDYIVAHHDKKTHSREYTAMFCVSSIDTLITYYELFKKKKEDGKHNLKIATIFSFTPNEEDKNANGLLADDVNLDPTSLSSHSRDKLDDYIEDYNKQYGTKYSTKDSQSFYNYYQDIAKRVKEYERESFNKKNRVDILLVVNMFLTGFDAKKLNTLYVDKNLRYHGLVQAFSRTNRILGEKKSQGNIVCFRNLKKSADKAIELFANENAQEKIIMAPYEFFVEKINELIEDLRKITPTPDSVNDLSDEKEELEFIKQFRDIIRQVNGVKGYSEFKYWDLSMDEQEFEDYKSKYLDLSDKVKSNQKKELVSILDDVDFELELIHRDEVNVAYILQLLSKLDSKNIDEWEKGVKAVTKLIDTNPQLRSKRELILAFIDQNMTNLDTETDLTEVFEAFQDEQKSEKLKTICQTEGLDYEGLLKLIDQTQFSGRLPIRDDVVGLLEEKPSLLKRKKIGDRIIDKIREFIEVFD